MSTAASPAPNSAPAEKDVPPSKLRLYAMDNLQLTDPALAKRLTGDTYHMLAGWIRQIVHLDAVSPETLKTFAAGVPGLNIVFSLYDIVHDVRTLASYDDSRSKMGYEVFPNWLDTGLDVIGLLPMPPMKSASMGLKTAMRMVFDPKVAANLLEQHLVSFAMGKVLEELEVIANREIDGWVDKVNGGYVQVIGGAQKAVGVLAQTPHIRLLDNVYRQFDKGGHTASQRFNNLLESAKQAGPKAIREALVTGNSEFEGLKSLTQHFVHLHRPKYAKVKSAAPAAKPTHASADKPANSTRMPAVDKPARPIAAQAENGHEHKYHNASTGQQNTNVKPQNMAMTTKANANLQTSGTAGPDCCPKNTTPERKRNTTKKPVHFATGEEILYQTDFTTPGLVPVAWTRCYRSSHAAYDNGLLGARWTSPYTTALTQTAGHFIYHDHTGRNVRLPLPAIGQALDIPFESFTLQRDSASVVSIVYRNGDRDEFRSSQISWSGNNEPIRYTLQAKHTQAGPALHTLTLPQIRARFGQHPVVALLSPDTLLVITDGQQLWIECRPATAEHFLADNPAAKKTVSDLATLHDANQKAGIAMVAGAATQQPAAWLTYLAQHIGHIEQILADGSRHTHVRYRYAPACDEHGTLLPADAGLDLVEQRDAEDQARSYAYASHLLTRYTDYTGFGHNLTWRTDPDWAPFSTRCIRTMADDGSDDTRLDYNPAFNETTVTDAAGVQKIYTYNHLNLITGVETVLADGSHPWYQNIWDKDGNLLKNIDPEGRTTRYRYDEHGNLIAVTNPAGATTRYEYDAANNPVKIIDPSGKAWQQEFDARGNLIKQTNPAGHATVYQYDHLGQLIGIIDAKGGASKLAYNALGQPIAHTDCSGKTTRFSYNALGHLIARTDAAGHVIRYETDRLGRIKTAILPDGSKDRYQYDANDQLTSYTDANGAVTRLFYNAHGQLATRIDANGHSLSYHYDHNQQLAKLVNQNGDTYEFTYDETGRLIAETGFDGKTTQYEYNSGGQLIASNSGKIRTEYLRDDNGRLLQKTVHPPVGGHVKPTTRYQYDAQGKLTWVKSRDGEIHFGYNDAGHLVEETQQVRLRQGTQVIERVFTFQHEVDELGNCLRTTLPNGRIVTTQRYGSGHWIGTLWNGSPIADLERDDLHREKVRQLGRNLQSQQRLIQTRSYDPLSRLASLKLIGLNHELLAARTQTYDPAGNLKQIEDWRRDKVSYDYDPVGQLLKATQPGLVETFAFDPAGNLTDGSAQKTAVMNKAGKDHDKWEEGLDYLTEQPQGETRPHIAPVTRNLLKRYLNMTFDHDAEGNTVKKIVKGGKDEQPYALYLTYDLENRLVKAVKPLAGQTIEAEYRYDAFGRRTAKIVRTLKEAKATGTYGYGGYSTYAGYGASYGYSTAARMETVSEDITFFAWDGDVLVQEIQPQKTVTYLYEPDSFTPLAQVHSDMPDSEYDSQTAQAKREQDAAREAQEEDEAEKLKWLKVTDKAAYEHAVQTIEGRKEQERQDEFGLLEAQARNDRIYYVNADHLGTPQEVVSEDGKVVWLARYKAWGRIHKLDVTDIAQPFRFQGQYFDEETGLHYNRHRYYDPDTARYLTQDPIRLQGGTNVYRYTANPSGWIDPLGLNSCKFSPLPNTGHLYRGVAANHPALPSAKEGVAVPAVSNGGASAVEHNEGGHSGNSQYTSWTRDVEIARWHANKAGPGGVILSAPLGAPEPGDCWSWEMSDDIYNEQEVLLKGRRAGLGVHKP